MRSLIAALALSVLSGPVFAATLNVEVDISEQTMKVTQDGRLLHQWPVSTARKGKYTPRGNYQPGWLSRHHKSSLYNGAPMPYSIFYDGNYAIHGTNQVSRLGTPASAGCVRLETSNAAILFNHVKAHGNGSLKIKIVD